jgi:glycosyltransferase involved in cell wall biosynthesis
MQKIIGTNAIGYPELRNFASLPFINYRVKKVYDIYKLLDFFYFKALNKSNYRFLNSFMDFDIHPVSILHFFNSISYDEKPWITTFETDLPRWTDGPSKRHLKGIKLITGKSCKAIIAISECTALLQKLNLEKFYPEFKDEVLSKLIVLHPAQSLMIDSISKKNFPADYINFTIVGADFFRKGGKEILNVFNRLIDNKAPVRLNIVSSLNYDDYATLSTKEDYMTALNIIGAHPNHIKYYNRLSNAEVLALFNKTHVGLLPTWADTYGYSLLEAQANGCPVISTNVRALPEINNNEAGWMIPVPMDNGNNALIDTPDERKQFSKIIEEGLESIIQNIITHPGSIEQKAKKSLERIKLFHDPGEKAAVLESLYDKILSS